MNTRMKSIRKVSTVLLSVISIIAGLVFSPTEKMTAKAFDPYHADFYTDQIKNVPDAGGFLTPAYENTMDSLSPVNYSDLKIDGADVSSKIQFTVLDGTYYIVILYGDLAPYTTETIHTFTCTYKTINHISSTFTIHVSQEKQIKAN